MFGNVDTQEFYTEPNRRSSTILFITGLPCTGKTYLGKQIAAHLSFPYLYKDGIKERLFDALGWSDRDWSKKIGEASYLLLFYFTEALLEAGESFILESNFSAERDGLKLHGMQAKYKFKAIEIQCVADGDIIVERYRLRWEAGNRHPGHVDPETYAELLPALSLGRLPRLGLQGEYFEVNTTSFEKVDVEGILRKIDQLLVLIRD
jgi:predicted kinase